MRPLFRRVLGAMLLLLVVTLGSLVLVYQNATRVNFGIYQTQHSRTVYRHIARVVARYYQQHHQSFSGVNSLVHSLSHLAPGPIQVRPLSTAPSHGPGAVAIESSPVADYGRRKNCRPPRLAVSWSTGRATGAAPLFANDESIV